MTLKDRSSDRRRFLGTATAAALVAGAPVTLRAQGIAARVVVIGGGFAGATAARFLRIADPALDVTLIEARRAFYSCPFSNLVLGGLRPLSAQRFTYENVEATGVRVVFDLATAIDPAAKSVRTAGGLAFGYDRLILAPGVDLIWDGLPGYDEAAAEMMPHAWKAGPQTALLLKQLQEMPDGGVVAMSAPANPYRCPPGPYERASMIAHFLKTYKPRSKLLLLDAKDRFSKQALFEQAWTELYGDLIEWRRVSDLGQITGVRPAERVFVTDFEEIRADVGNVIPPQRAAAIARIAGVTDRTGWCPIDPVTFESRLQPDIHVLGDASIAGAMPKSAFSANAQGKVCAVQIARLLRGEAPIRTTLANTCYSLVAPGYGISIAGVYKPGAERIEAIEGAGGTSPLDAPAENRRLEAAYGERWFSAITSEVFG